MPCGADGLLGDAHDAAHVLVFQPYFVEDEEEGVMGGLGSVFLLGCHGVTWVAEASGVNRDTIYKGIHELKADEQIPKGRVRKPGRREQTPFRQKWTEHLQWQYPNADTICLLCDGGGASSFLHHIFKQELMKLAKEIGMNILVVHYPPYCSKYNPIEHRLFAPITRSWSGAPLLSVEMARQRADSTKTGKGLKVYATINSKSYETKRPVESTFESDKQKNIIFDDCLPKWNYLVKVV